ncbi:hypothetical protein LX36DRAFT_218710 [Colletotrichum falcatum]|nr:hypothetical protein LX36DRAFT_218710 [Colletotrichum falcatum]
MEREREEEGSRDGRGRKRLSWPGSERREERPHKQLSEADAAHPCLPHHFFPNRGFERPHSDGGVVPIQQLGPPSPHLSQCVRNTVAPGECRGLLVWLAPRLVSLCVEDVQHPGRITAGWWDSKLMQVFEEVGAITTKPLVALHWVKAIRSHWADSCKSHCSRIRGHLVTEGSRFCEPDKPSMHLAFL